MSDRTLPAVNSEQDRKDEVYLMNNPETCECQCDECVNACKSLPGRFTPDQIGKVAEFLGLTSEEYLQRYAIKTNAGREDCDTIRPVSVAEVGVNRAYSQWCDYVTGGIFTRPPYHLIGDCIHLKDNLCEIHPVKPRECAELKCGGCISVDSELEINALWKGKEGKKLLAIVRRNKESE